jgi:hypothetical protein
MSRFARFDTIGQYRTHIFSNTQLASSQHEISADMLIKKQTAVTPLEKPMVINLKRGFLPVVQSSALNITTHHPQLCQYAQLG